MESLFGYEMSNDGITKSRTQERCVESNPPKQVEVTQSFSEMRGYGCVLKVYA